MRETWRKQAIADILSKHGAEKDKQLETLLLEHAEVAIKLELAGEENYEQKGCSRIAGRPDLPPAIDWPCTEDGEWYTFLAQINLSDLPFLPSDDWPAAGMLYFFLGADEPAYDVDHRVLFYDGDLQELTLASPPEGKEEVFAEDRDFVPHRVTFRPQLSLPDMGEQSDGLLDQNEALYMEICDQSDALAGGLQSWCGDTQLDAYLCRHGMKEIMFETHRTPEQLLQKARQAMENGQEQYAEHLEHKALPLLLQFKDREKEHREAARDWQVLLSLSSLDAVNMCWWDAGFLEFLIDRNDLKRRRFDRTYLNLATS
ncbi:YwqG family protein [Paenibacillus senegalensis]|uniref:YwqG family protein n=1 Tax=Paenibacillus senegalensis TaxID=1465766 RepID=UPI00028885DE|nr:YwqG family protein [Paenibacillus senegalensis]